MRLRRITLIYVNQMLDFGNHVKIFRASKQQWGAVDKKAHTRPAQEIWGMVDCSKVEMCSYVLLQLL